MSKSDHSLPVDEFIRSALKPSLETHLSIGDPSSEGIQIAESLLAEQDEGGEGTKGISAVGFHAWATGETTLVSLTRQHPITGPGEHVLGREKKKGGGGIFKFEETINEWANVNHEGMGKNEKKWGRNKKKCRNT